MSSREFAIQRERRLHYKTLATASTDCFPQRHKESFNTTESLLRSVFAAPWSLNLHQSLAVQTFLSPPGTQGAVPQAVLYQRCFFDTAPSFPSAYLVLPRGSLLSQLLLFRSLVTAGALVLPSINALCPPGRSCWMLQPSSLTHGTKKSSIGLPSWYFHL